MNRSLVGFLGLMLMAGSTVGQTRHTENTLRLDPGAAPAPAAIEDIAWLAGAWEGEAFGGRFEDVWSAPSARTMMGMFKVIEADAPSFYELQLIVEREGSLAWLVKHFSADFTAWEEKEAFVTFPLVRLTESSAFFSGLTVRRVSVDELQVFLAMEKEDGPVEVEMVYRRQGTHRAREP